MKKIKSIANIFLLLILFSSCHGDEVAIRGRYRFSNGAIVYADKEIGIIDELWNGYGFENKIPRYVHDYSCDEKYIIAFQIPDSNSYKFKTNESCQKHGVEDSLYNQWIQAKNIEHCFWIIKMKTNEVIGPMDKDNFKKE